MKLFPEFFNENGRNWVNIPKNPKPSAPQLKTEDEHKQIGKENKSAEEDWRLRAQRYVDALHASSEYRLAASKFNEQQRREPQPLEPKVHGGGKEADLWVYREKVLKVESMEPPPLRDNSSLALLIKHHVLRRERDYEKIRREVEALENIETLERVSREPISESVRLFVWQRDKGQCVKCGARERLEFDHIIPIASGGSSIERNVQLLCESCNRSKGASV